MSPIQIIMLIASIIELISKLINAIREDPAASAAIREFSERTLNHLTNVENEIKDLKEKEETQGP